MQMLKLVCRDGYQYITENVLRCIALEKFPRLRDHCRKQLLWIIRELIYAKATGIAEAANTLVACRVGI